MSIQTFSIRDAIKIGWKKTFQYFPFWLGVLLIYFIISSIPQSAQIIASFFGPYATPFSIIIIFAFIAISCIMSMGFIRASLTITDDLEPKFSLIYQDANQIWRYLGANLLVTLIVFLGFLVFIIPGIYFSLVYFSTPYLIIDKRLGVFEALHQSSRITKGFRWKILGASIILTLINFAGVLAFGIGLFITLPLTMIAYAYLYRQLSPSSEPVPPIQAAASQEPVPAIPLSDN